MKRILITGSENGFVASHLYKYLCSLKYEVSFLGKEDFNNKNFAALYQQPKPDVVVHTAWTRCKDIHSLEHLDFAKQSCEFFNYCKDAGLRVINLGSHAEYSVNEVSKETDRCEPVTTYGIAKLATTLHAKNLGYNTLRLFAVTGEGGRQFKSIYENASGYNHKENVKDYVPIEMVCHAVVRLMYAQHLYGEIINVATGKQETAEEIAKEIEGAREKWNMYQQRQYEQSEWRGDTEKMEKILNIKPESYES